MKTGMPISAFAQELRRQTETKQDLVVDTGVLTMEVEDRDGERTDPRLRIGGLDKEAAVELARDWSGTLGIGEIAHHQIGARLNIPRSYYGAMLADAPDLLATNVNHWLSEKPERRMVRTLDGRARAFLSDRYQRIDNWDVANMALPILETHEGLQVMSCEVTERRMYLKAITPRIHGDVKVGDTVQAGVMITNSEVGHGALAISPFTHRLVCLNGMVVADEKWRKTHLGGRHDMGDDLYAMLTDETRALDDKATLMKVRDLVAAALDQATFDNRIDRMREAAGEKIKGDPIKAVEVLARKFTFTKGETSDVMRNLIEGADLSRWGIANAVTRVANEHGDYDRATEFEAAGGKILDLSPREWHEVAEAA